MEQVSFTEAKAKLAALVDRAEAGEEIIITRHGHPAARLVPGNPSKATVKKSRRMPGAKYTVAEAVARIKAAPRINATIEEIISWKHEGHKY